jgi:methyl-accepting chemotaxis protein
MKTTMTLSTRAKLFLGFGLIILLMLIVILTSYLSLVSIKQTKNDLQSSVEAKHNITEIKSECASSRAKLLELFLEKDKAKFSAILKTIKCSHDSIEGAREYLKKELTSFAIEVNTTDKLFVHLEDYLGDVETLANRVVAGALNENFAGSVDSISEHYNLINEEVYAMEQKLTAVMVSHDEEFDADMMSAILKSSIIGVIAILMTILMAVWMIRMLRKLSHEIREGIGILTTSASEILTTATEVTTGATETSTAVAETTTTIEEVRQTALLSNQKAKSVLESSQKASQAAQNGKTAVQDTIEGMKKIQQQMNLIADSVVKLSEQSRVIGDITTSVTDLADQSNLLAVNAAIEAAKAGEQGRGFAVVAQEIRSLAEQSKGATAQVKEILNDIQRAVNQVVMATEQGAKAVENGNQLSVQSGHVIDLLSGAITDATQSAMQISSSSQQQMAGMDQIVPAMENIKQASEQNVIGTKQTQIAAHNLNDLGQNMKKLLEKFNV